jgi:hypothetical protein
MLPSAEDQANWLQLIAAAVRSNNTVLQHRGAGGQDVDVDVLVAARVLQKDLMTAHHLLRDLKVTFAQFLPAKLQWA